MDFRRLSFLDAPYQSDDDGDEDNRPEYDANSVDGNLSGAEVVAGNGVVVTSAKIAPVG